MLRTLDGLAELTVVVNAAKSLRQTMSSNRSDSVNENDQIGSTYSRARSQSSCPIICDEGNYDPFDAL